MNDRIADSRRKRRDAQGRRLRLRRRRRALLLCLAAAALVAGVTVGSGGSGDATGDEERGNAAGDRGPGNAAREEATEEAKSKPPTVTGFEDPVPILMYHAIGSAPPGTAYPDLFVPVGELKAQLRWLARHGYHAVTLDELFAAWEDEAPIAKKPVVLSFDDGLRSQYAAALPLLGKMGWAGVLNLKVESLDQGELTDDMVREMIDAGWEVDSHTLTHPDVTTLDGRALRREIAGSRRELRRRFDIPVNFFAYPAGAYDEGAVAAVRRAGYKGAVTTEPGFASRGEPYTLKRVRIDGGDGAGGLAEKLGAG